MKKMTTKGLKKIQDMNNKIGYKWLIYINQLKTTDFTEIELIESDITFYWYKQQYC